MGGPFFDDSERAEIGDVLADLGPDAPTLLSDWTTRDIAAHLVLREHDPFAAPGLVLPGPWRRFARSRQDAVARGDFGALVATVRAGTSRGFFRLGWVRRGPNLNEYFVHHEDIRRANHLGRRTHSGPMQQALWDNVTRSHRYLTRRLRTAGVEIHWAGTTTTIPPRGRAAGRGAGLAGRPPGDVTRGSTVLRRPRSSRRRARLTAATGRRTVER